MRNKAQVKENRSILDLDIPHFEEDLIANLNRAELQYSRKIPETLVPY
jgi:hypothetical protein